MIVENIVMLYGKAEINNGSIGMDNQTNIRAKPNVNC